MNRRSFLKLCGLAAHGLAFGFGTTGCVTPPKDITWAEVPDKEFSLDKFDDWFVAHKLYNGINPKLKIFQRGYEPTFYSSIVSRHGSTPGWTCISNCMYALADGVVIGVETLNTGRLGGGIVSFLHKIDPEDSGLTFISYYAHLNNLHFDVEAYNQGEKVKIGRGQPIADVAYPSHAKVMFSRNRNLVDPDNYGPSHSYMDYHKGNDIPTKNTATKHHKQQNICHEFIRAAISELKEKLILRKHVDRKKEESLQCRWDLVEQFRYCDLLYNARPKMFPIISREQFGEMKNEFYENQPIILTLPLKA